jgi:hypothetical protein
MEYHICKKLKEHFEKEESNDPFCDPVTDGIFSILAFALSCYAAYLSWNCGTKGGVQTPLKVFNAFFAFIFGSFYILSYFIFNPECSVK